MQITLSQGTAQLVAEAKGPGVKLQNTVQKILTPATKRNMKGFISKI
jgi:hypothetical protein